MAAVYIADILKTVSDANRPTAKSTLQGFFDAITKDRQGPGMTVSFLADDAKTKDVAIVGLDIIVYLMPFGMSVLRKKYDKAPSPISGHGGLTYWENNGPTISEVYASSAPDGVILGKLIFHEIMHMKTRRGNVMHTGATGLDSATVTPNTTLTDLNKTTMAAALKVAVPQWADGVDLQQNKKKAMASGDPLAGITE